MNLELLLLVVLHVACLLLQVAMLRFGLRRRRLYTFFFLAVIFYQAVSLLSLAGLVSEHGALLLLQAEMIALVGTAIVSAVVVIGDVLIPVPRRSDAFAGPLEAVVARPGAYLAIASGGLTVATALMLRGGMGFAERTWQQSRLDAGYLDSLATFMLFMAFPAAWIAARSRHAWLSVLLLLWSLALFVVFGSRAALLTLPMVVALDFFARFGTTRIRVRTVVLVVVAALGLHIVGRIVRGFGLAGLIALVRGQALGADEFQDIVANLDLSGGEAAIFRYFLFVVSAGPFTDVAPLTSVIRWLGMYVPSGLFPGAKPADLTYAVWWHAYSAGVFDSYDSFGEILKVIGAGGGGSVHPLVWGEMWVNGAWPAAPVFAAALAALLLIIDGAYARVPDVAYVLAAPATLIGYVMVARGNSVIGIGYTAYVLPMALVAWALLHGGAIIIRGRWSLDSSNGPDDRLQKR